MIKSQFPWCMEKQLCFEAQLLLQAFQQQAKQVHDKMIPKYQLFYFTDPMCSWCYGFGPELDILINKHPEMNMTIIPGGLRTDKTKSMNKFQAVLTTASFQF